MIDFKYFLLIVYFFFFTNVLYSQSDSFKRIVESAIEKNNPEILRNYFSYQSNSNTASKVPDLLFRHYRRSDFEKLVWLYDNEFIKLNSTMYFSESLLAIACKYNELTFVSQELAKFPDLLYVNGQTTLMILCKYNCIDLALKYLNPTEAMKVDNYGNNVLYFCSGHSNYELINQLIAYGVNLNNKNNFDDNLLKGAVKRGNRGLVYYLLKTLNASYNPEEDNLLDAALFSRQLDLVELFANLEKEQINNVSFYGDPLLIKGVSYYESCDNRTFFKIIEVLLANGYNLNSCDKKGNPLLAHCGDNIGLFQFLVEKKVDINFLNKNGQNIVDLIEKESVINFTINGDDIDYSIMAVEDLNTAISKLIILERFTEAKNLISLYQEHYNKN